MCIIVLRHRRLTSTPPLEFLQKRAASSDIARRTRSRREAPSQDDATLNPAPPSQPKRPSRAKPPPAAPTPSKAALATYPPAPAPEPTPETDAPLTNLSLPAVSSSLPVASPTAPAKCEQKLLDDLSVSVDAIKSRLEVCA